MKTDSIKHTAHTAMRAPHARNLGTRRTVAPCSRMYLAEQLETVLHFTGRFWMHTPDAMRSAHIRSLLETAICSLQEPDNYSHYNMAYHLRVCLTQMQNLYADNPSLRDTPAYQGEYEQNVATITHVIEVGELESLLSDTLNV